MDADDNHLERKNASQSLVFSEEFSEEEVSRKRKAKFFFVMIVWGILGVALASWACTGYRTDEEREVTSSREADISVVKVYGADVLTELPKRAIQEKRPDGAIETDYKPLKNKVWIEGTTGAGYMPLSPKRVDRMEAARAKGKRLFSTCQSTKGGDSKDGRSGERPDSR